MNKLSLDMSDPDIAEALNGCEDGEHVEFTVGGTLKKTAKAAEVDLDEVKYTGSDDESKEPADDMDDNEAGDKTPSSEADASPPKAKSKFPAALAIVMAHPKPAPKGSNKQSN